jgi:hypothetical protein
LIITLGIKQRRQDFKLTFGKDMGLTIELHQHLPVATNPILRDVGKLNMNPCENLNIMHNYNKIVMIGQGNHGDHQMTKKSKEDKKMITFDALVMQSPFLATEMFYVWSKKDVMIPNFFTQSPPYCCCFF